MQRTARPSWGRIAGLLVPLLVGCSHPTILEGTVLDERGAPIGKAAVVLVETGQGATTGPDGRFVFELEDEPEAVTVLVSGRQAAGGPYSSALVRTPVRPWNLAPGGQYRDGVLQDGVVLSTAAVLTRLQVETALPVRGDEGGLVVSSGTLASDEGYRGARLTVPERQKGWGDASEVAIALTRIRLPLLPVPPPDGTAGLAAVHVAPDLLTFDPKATLELPGPAGLGAAGEVRLYRLDPAAHRYVDVGPGQAGGGRSSRLVAPGILPGGGHYLFAVTR